MVGEAVGVGVTEAGALVDGDNELDGAVLFDRLRLIDRVRDSEAEREEELVCEREGVMLPLFVGVLVIDVVALVLLGAVTDTLALALDVILRDLVIEMLEDGLAVKLLDAVSD